MSHQSELIETDIEAYLCEHERKDLLRLLTCGSVDDGKSTLIGRLLHDSKLVYEDQLASISAETDSAGGSSALPDLALLTDGLKAEREQGITIDVAYRYFSTSKRKFIIADTPGHEQYARNMVTGASTCGLAIILIDARRSVMAQTKRHSYISSLLGIRNLVVAVNKMDLVDYSERKFVEICEAYLDFAKQLDIAEPCFIPMSALHGDMVVDRGDRLGWFGGPTLMHHLETVEVASASEPGSFRLPVQMVVRPDSDFRGFAGTVATGAIAVGDVIVALPAGTRSTVERIVTFDGDIDTAGPGQAVTLTLADQIDISRGDVLVRPGEPPLKAHDIDATLVWMSDAAMIPGKRYVMQSCNGVCSASVATITSRVDINTLERVQATELGLNDIAEVVVTSDRELLFDPYRTNRHTGSFILVDRLSNATVAAGMISGASSPWERTPEPSLTHQGSGISASERTARYQQRPCTVLLTGLSGAGKSTLATALARRLFDLGKTAVRLDGENVRLGISRDLGFSAQERSENLRRVSEVARLMNRQGFIAVAALAAPKASVRERARDLIGSDRYVEVFVDTPIDVCRQRDQHGLYQAADRGEIPQFPGVSATYDRPVDADLRVDTTEQSIAECIELIVTLLEERGFLVSGQ